jgi:hypothetical protein
MENSYSTSDQIVKEKMVKMLFTFLEIENKNKALIDQSYLQISDKTFKEIQKEKKTFINLKDKDLDSTEKRLIMEMKKLSIGIWAEGKIGLVNYNKNAYDRAYDDEHVLEDQDNENEVIQNIIEIQDGEEKIDDYRLDEDDDYKLDAGNDDAIDMGDGDGNDNDDDDNYE